MGLKSAEIIKIITTIFDRCYPGIDQMVLPSELSQCLQGKGDSTRIVLRNRTEIDQLIPVLFQASQEERIVQILGLTPELQLALFDRLVFGYNFLKLTSRDSQKKGRDPEYRGLDMLVGLLTAMYKKELIHSYLSSRKIPYIDRFNG